jgi:holo-[acyl-carrier protein] synthase
MITGVGIDVVHVKRMERWLLNSKLLERYFHPEEIMSVSSRGKSVAQSLAVRFAAKEAFGKALGTGLAGITLKDIVVLNKYGGKPELKLSGTAQEALDKSGADRVHISLTHERETAIAMIVLERA